MAATARKPLSARTILPILALLHIFLLHHFAMAQGGDRSQTMASDWCRCLDISCETLRGSSEAFFYNLSRAAYRNPAQFLPPFMASHVRACLQARLTNNADESARLQQLIRNTQHNNTSIVPLVSVTSVSQRQARGLLPSSGALVIIDCTRRLRVYLSQGLSMSRIRRVFENIAQLSIVNAFMGRLGPYAFADPTRVVLHACEIMSDQRPLRGQFFNASAWTFDAQGNLVPQAGGWIPEEFINPSCAASAGRAQQIALREEREREAQEINEYVGYFMGLETLTQGLQDIVTYNTTGNVWTSPRYLSQLNALESQKAEISTRYTPEQRRQLESRLSNLDGIPQSDRDLHWLRSEAHRQSIDAVNLPESEMPPDRVRQFEEVLRRCTSDIESLCNCNNDGRRTLLEHSDLSREQAARLNNAWSQFPREQTEQRHCSIITDLSFF